MKPMYTRMLLASLVLFILCMGAFCEDVVDGTCGNGFEGDRGSYTVGEFGGVDDPDAAALEAFLNAVAEFDVAATALVGDLEDACRSMGQDLGVPDEEMPEGDLEATCQAVAAQIEEDRAAFEEANLTLVAEFEPAVCNVDFSISADCYARCDVNIDIDAVPPVCSGGGVYVNCDVGCRGECRLPSASVECNGSCQATCSGGCEGTCSGSCSGTCSGRCNGECTNTLEDGTCAGVCTGECVGSCDAECSGSCWGQCTGSCDGECIVEIDGGGCEGECWGSCEADVVPISCEGGYIDIETTAECEAACEAEASFHAECTEPRVFITFEGDIEGIAARADIYAAAMENNLPLFLELIEDLALTVETGTELVATAGGGLSAAVNLGARAIACTTLAYSVSVEISIEIEVAVEVGSDVQTSTQVSAQ